MAHVESRASPRPATEETEDVVACYGRCGRRLKRPQDAEGRIVLCRRCWAGLLRVILNLIRVGKEEV